MRGRISGTFLCGFIIGLLVGAAATLILAPASGEETRARLSEWRYRHGGVPLPQPSMEAAELPGDGGVGPR